MAGEAGSLGRAFVEIHVPVESFASQMTSVGTTFTSQTSKMIAEAQLVSAAIGSANAGIISSYNAVATSVMGLLTAQEMAILSTNNLSLALHHGDVIMRSTAAGGVLVGTGMTAAAVGTKGFTLSLTSLMAMAKSVLPLMAAFMAVSKTIGIAGGAVSSQREFNKELYQLWTLTDLSSQGIEDLGDEIRGLVYDYNVMAAAGTKAMYQIYSATFYGAEATEIFEQGMKAAAAGVTDLMSAVDMTTTVLNAYGMAASESARVNDLLFTAVRFGKTTYSELASQFGRLAGVAAPAGARLEEMTAAIATLTRQGIMTDWAVTSLRQTIMSMFRPTGALAGVIKSLGYETGRSLIQQNGFVGALKLVKEKADATGIPLENLFTNVRAITAVLPLLTTASQGFADDMERMAMATGTMDIAFAKVEQSWDYRIERLKSQLNDLGISVGEMLIPAVESFLTIWAELGLGIEGVVEMLGPLGEMMAEATGYMTAGATAAGLFAGGIWLVYKAVTALIAHPVIAGMVALGAVIGAIVARTADLASEAREARKELERYQELQVSSVTDPENLTPSQARNVEERTQEIQAALSEAFATAEITRLRTISDIFPQTVGDMPRAGLTGTAQIFPLADQERAVNELPALAEALKDEVYLVSKAILDYFGYTIEQLRDYGLVVEEGMGEVAHISPEDTAASAWDWVSDMFNKVADAASRLDPTDVEGSLEAFEDLEDYLGASEDALALFISKGWEGVPMLEELKERIEDLLGAESTFESETRLLISAFYLAGEGTIQQAELLQELAGRYETAIELQRALASAGIEVDSVLAQLTNDLYPFKGAIEEVSGAVKEAIQSIAGIATQTANQFGGEKTPLWVGVVKLVSTAFSDLAEIFEDLAKDEAASGEKGIASGITGVLAAINPYLGLASAGLELIFAGLNYQSEQAAEKRAEEQSAIDATIDSAYELADALWSLAESAESVAAIQEGLAQLQVNIMSSLLAFLWPLAGILGYINELFVIQADVIEKEVKVREKMLSNLNVPIGFPINRIRFAAGTPGEPVTFDEDDIGGDVDEIVDRILTWWEEALEPFRAQILEMIQPIADFRDAMRELAIDLVPAMLQILEPIIATFGATLGEISRWMTDVFAPDFEAFAAGFATFWEERVDPFWTEDMFPQLQEWFETLYGWLGDIIDFFADEGWDFLSGPVWERVRGFVNTVLGMFQDFGEWIDENWDDIEANLLNRLGTVLGDIIGDLDTVLTNIENWLLGTDIDTDEVSDWEWLMGIIGGILDFLSQGLSSFRQLVEDIAGIFGWFFRAVGTVANLFIDMLNMGFDAINWALGWLGVHLDHIPRFNTSRSEAGTEAINPLAQMTSMMSTQPSAAGMAGGGGFESTGGAGGSAVTINVNLSQERLSQIMIRKMTSQNVNDNGVGFAPIRVG